MRIFHTLKTENGARDVLYYLRSTFSPRDYENNVYDYHIAPEITHFIDTSGIIDIEGKDYEIKPGDIFLLCSNAKHRIRRIDSCGMIENIRFDPIFLWQSNDSFDFHYLNIFDPTQAQFESRLSRTNPSCQIIRDLLAEICTEFEAKRYGFAHMVKMRLFMILLTLIRDFGCASESSSTLRAPNLEGIRATMRYIDEHLDESLAISDLSAIAGLSPNYYGTLFKQLNGITPVEYITSKRILRAIELLPEFDGTMLDLALACGFNNTANFNRAFRAYTGQVPSKYVPPIK